MTSLTHGERAAALATLGLPERATAQQISQAYRRLARTAHPDVTGRTDRAAGDRFAAISDAYHRLVAPMQQTDPQVGYAVVRPARTVSPPGRRPPIVAGPVTITAPSTAAHHPLGVQREQ